MGEAAHRVSASTVSGLPVAFGERVGHPEGLPSCSTASQDALLPPTARPDCLQSSQLVFRADEQVPSMYSLDISSVQPSGMDALSDHSLVVDIFGAKFLAHVAAGLGERGDVVKNIS